MSGGDPPVCRCCHHTPGHHMGCPVANYMHPLGNGIGAVYTYTPPPEPKRFASRIRTRAAGGGRHG